MLGLNCFSVMENPDQDLLLLQSVRRTQGTGNDAAVSSVAEQEEKEKSEPNTQPESNQETLEPRSRPPSLALIEFRIQQLQNRRLILMKMQHLKKKTEDNSGRTTEEMTCEDSDQLSELEAIQKELEEVLAKKEMFEKRGKNANFTGNEADTGQQGSQDSFYITETPCGGIYMLPPPQLTQEDIALQQEIQTRFAEVRPTGAVIEVGSLSRRAAVTKCPSCNEVVITETRSTVGETIWTLCCLCTIMGCVAGCCLIPFFIDHLKSVQHQCPQCQAHIHTYRPF